MLISLSACLPGYSQQFLVVDSSQKAVSFRGMSMVNERTVWVAGSKGTIGRTTDGGASWQWVNPTGFGKRDFRDIEAFDANTAVAMAVDSPGILLKTSDGGQTWKVVYEDHRRGIFLDAMDFRGSHGIALGDPIDGRFVLLETNDSGDSWKARPSENCPEALAGEACFAASGGNIFLIHEPKKQGAFFVTGGVHSRIHFVGTNSNKWDAKPIAIMQGAQMTGANAIINLGDNFLVVGGDYLTPHRSDSTFFEFGSNQQPDPVNLTSPIGYISGVCATNKHVMVSGLRGIAIAGIPTGRETRPRYAWQLLTTLPFHVIKAKGVVAFAAGPNGRIARIR